MVRVQTPLFPNEKTLAITQKNFSRHGTEGGGEEGPIEESICLGAGNSHRIDSGK